MTYYLVTRHAGALEWLRRQPDTPRDIVHLSHIDSTDRLVPGDIVVGPLPINMIADVVARGVRYFAIDMDLPQNARGPELNADTMERYSARRVEYRVVRLPADAPAAEGER